MKNEKNFIILIVVLIIFTGGFAIQYAFSEALVPLWVKNTAKWYGEDKITEREFVNAIQYLINNNIIQVKNPQQSVLIPEPDDTKEELMEKGIDELLDKNNEAAIRLFDAALKKDPENIGALVDKGIAQARLGKFQDAQKLFDFAIQVSEKKGQVDYRAVVNAGIALSIYGDPNKAIEYFDRVLNNENKVRQETLVAALVNKGVTLLEQGKHEESIQYFDRALEIEPNRLGAIINKANALQELHRYNEALKFFAQAYAIDSEPLSWKPKFVIIQLIGGAALQ